MKKLTKQVLSLLLAVIMITSLIVVYSENKEKKVAYVVPTFTYTAYADNGFYDGFDLFINDTLDFVDLKPYFNPTYKNITKNIDLKMVSDLGIENIITSVEVHTGDIHQFIQDYSRYSDTIFQYFK